MPVHYAKKVAEAIDEVEREVRILSSRVQEERGKVRQRRQTSAAKLEELKQALMEETHNEETHKEAPENVQR